MDFGIGMCKIPLAKYMPSYGESDQRMHDVHSIYAITNFKMLGDLFVCVRGVCRGVS
jgi:hypothetical protein